MSASMNWNVPNSEPTGKCLITPQFGSYTEKRKTLQISKKILGGSRVSNCIVALEKEIATKTSAAETDAVSARVSTASNAIQRQQPKTAATFFLEMFLMDFYFENIRKS